LKAAASFARLSNQISAQAEGVAPYGAVPLFAETSKSRAGGNPNQARFWTEPLDRASPRSKFINLFKGASDSAAYASVTESGQCARLEACVLDAVKTASGLRPFQVQILALA